MNVRMYVPAHFTVNESYSLICPPECRCPPYCRVFDVAVCSSGRLCNMAVRTAVALRTHCNLQRDDLYFMFRSHATCVTTLSVGLTTGYSVDL